MAPTPTLVDFQKIVVASQPTPGMGLALDYNGKLPTLKKLLGCDYGQVTLTYAGVSPGSNPLTVAHLIGAVPSAVVVTNSVNSGLNFVPVASVDTLTTTSFRLFSNTIDAQVPLASATSVFFWFAIA